MRETLHFLAGGSTVAAWLQHRLSQALDSAGTHTPSWPIVRGQTLLDDTIVL